MRLIILDSDQSYLNSVRVVISSQMKEYVEVFSFTTTKELLEVEQFVGLGSYLLIHESFINEFELNHQLLNICQKSCLGILSEGITKAQEFSEFFESVCFDPTIQVKKSKVYMKYQPINTLLSRVKDDYLSTSSGKLVSGQKSTKLISLYHPYGSVSKSKWTETTLKNLPSQFKILIIHYDPFYNASNKEKFNLSYLYTLIKRGKTDLSLGISEVKSVLSHNVDVIHGPGNMLDIDCLSEEENEIYIQGIANSLDYDVVLLNFNGVHISKHILGLLEVSSDAILCHEDDDVQLSVTRQTNITWTLMMNNLDNVLKEVIIKNGKEHNRL